MVGILGGIAASLLKGLTHWIAKFLQDQVTWEYKYYLYLLFPLLGILFTVLYVRAFIRKSKFQHGISSILTNISKQSGKMDVHNVYSQIFTSALTVGFGGSAGLEAPIVSSGSAIGSNIGRFFGLSYRETILLLACGAAAGIAGAFNSPVAGMIFAIEILLPEFSIPAFIPLLIASATSSVISRLFYNEPLFVLVSNDWVPEALLFYILLAVLLGFYSIFFNRLNTAVSNWFAKIKNPFNKVWVGGLSLGGMIALFPALYGEGYITIQELLNGNYNRLLENSILAPFAELSWLLLLFACFTIVAKTFASMITMSSGGNGGMFGPSVVVGGLFGFAFSYGLNLTGLVYLNITNFIVAGMAAAMAGVMHAPLTAIFLSAEITGGYMLMVPLMMVAAISYFINKAINKHSIYTKNLEESGTLLHPENQDRNILRMMKVRYLLEKDFVSLHPEDTPASRKKDIVGTTKNLFPVVDTAGKLTGILYSDRLLELLTSDKPEDREKLMKDIAQPAENIIRIDAHMLDVMQIMDRKDTRILPVVDEEGNYLGFITKHGIFNKYRQLLVRRGDFMED